MALVGAALSLGAGPAGAAEATVLQDGTGGAVHVEQEAANAAARVTQHGSGNLTQVQQAGAIGSSVAIDQAGAGNRLDVWQLQGSLDVLDAVQAGTLNTARLLQSGGAGSTRNLLVLRQAGSSGSVDVQQLAVGASAAVYQSASSSGDRATLVQAASAPIGVIQQGVARGHGHQPLDAASEAALVRGGGLADAVSSQSSAILQQSGGAGLSGIIVQSGSGQSASIAQSGAYLEAEIVQAGGAHTATIVQAGAGSAPSPYRASIQQFGAQPQAFSIQQTAGAAPRVIRVIQQ